MKQCAVHNQTFCTNDTTYPSEFIQRILAQSDHKILALFDDIVPTETSIVNRHDSEEIELCDTNSIRDYPLSATNTKGKDFYIVNVDNFKQVVTISVCMSEKCNDIVTLPDGYRTECIQQFVPIQLVSLSPEGQPMRDVFPFPVYCSCSVFRNQSISKLV